MIKCDEEAIKYGTKNIVKVSMSMLNTVWPHTACTLAHIHLHIHTNNDAMWCVCDLRDDVDFVHNFAQRPLLVFNFAVVSFFFLFRLCRTILIAKMSHIHMKPASLSHAFSTFSLEATTDIFLFQTTNIVVFCHCAQKYEYETKLSDCCRRRRQQWYDYSELNALSGFFFVCVENKFRLYFPCHATITIIITWNENILDKNHLCAHIVSFPGHYELVNFSFLLSVCLFVCIHRFVYMVTIHRSLVAEKKNSNWIDISLFLLARYTVAVVVIVVQQQQPAK